MIGTKSKTGRIQPAVVRKRAVDLYTQGHAIPDIAKSIGVDSSTVRRWCRATGAVHGGALAHAPPPESPEEILNPAVVAVVQPEPHINGDLDPSPVQRLLNAEQVMGAIEDAMARPGDTADKYQAIVVALGLNMLKGVAAMPPAVKTVRDLATLNDMIRQNLGLNTKGSGGGALAINLNVLTKGSPKTSGVTVDAEFAD
jgi:transposase-like protein